MLSIPIVAALMVFGAALGAIHFTAVITSRKTAGWSYRLRVPSCSGSKHLQVITCCMVSTTVLWGYISIVTSMCGMRMRSMDLSSEVRILVPPGHMIISCLLVLVLQTEAHGGDAAAAAEAATTDSGSEGDAQLVCGGG